MGTFARELADILAAHQGQDLGIWSGQGPRGDPVWYPLRRLAISSPLIHRLKRAAVNEREVAALSPADIQQLAQLLKLRPRELRRLRAALLAHAIEVCLMRRRPAGGWPATCRAAHATFIAFYPSDLESEPDPNEDPLDEIL